MSSVIFWGFVILYCGQFLFDAYLILLNARYASAPDKKPPPDLLPYLDKEQYYKSRAYTLAKSKFHLITSILGVGVLFVVLGADLFEHYDQVLRAMGFSEIWRGIGYVLTVTLAVMILGLPADLYFTFVLEQRFGFNKTTLRLFVQDLLKGIALNLIIMVPILYLIFYFVEIAGSYWWLWAASGVLVIQFALAYLYPIIIAPLFNKFSKLDDDLLQRQIEQLSLRIGFPLSDIQVMDGSRRSKHSNAYFTGFGNHKRIVLFDTLIDRLSSEEIVAVLAHELGHWKFRHIHKRMALVVIFSYLLFYLVSLTITYEPFFRAFNVTTPSPYLGFLLFALVFSTIVFWASPLIACYSRQKEYDADQFALNHSPNGAALKSALIKLNVENLDNLYPHPWYAAFYYSHPPLIERLAALQTARE